MGTCEAEDRYTSRGGRSSALEQGDHAVEVGREASSGHAVVHATEHPRLDLAVRRLMAVGPAVRELVGARARRVARARQGPEPAHARSVGARVLAGALFETPEVGDLGGLVEGLEVGLRVSHDLQIAPPVGRGEDGPDPGDVGRGPVEDPVEQRLGAVEGLEGARSEVVPGLTAPLIDEVGLKQAVGREHLEVAVPFTGREGRVGEEVLVHTRCAHELDERPLEDVRPRSLGREATAREVSAHVVELPALEERRGNVLGLALPAIRGERDPAAGAGGRSRIEAVDPPVDPEGREPGGLLDRLVDRALEASHEGGTRLSRGGVHVTTSGRTRVSYVDSEG